MPATSLHRGIERKIGRRSVADHADGLMKMIEISCIATSEEMFLTMHKQPILETKG